MWVITFWPFPHFSGTTSVCCTWISTFTTAMEWRRLSTPRTEWWRSRSISTGNTSPAQEISGWVFLNRNPKLWYTHMNQEKYTLFALYSSKGHFISKKVLYLKFCNSFEMNWADTKALTVTFLLLNSSLNFFISPKKFLIRYVVYILNSHVTVGHRSWERKILCCQLSSPRWNRWRVIWIYIQTSKLFAFSCI